MTKDAYKVFSTQFNQLTGEEHGVSNKQIVIPSFGTTSKILGQHFSILRELKNKINLLKQAYEF
jgi:hypothetical protein